MSDAPRPLEIVRQRVARDLQAGEARVAGARRMRFGCFASLAAIIAGLVFYASRLPPGLSSKDEIFGYGEGQLAPVIASLERFYAAHGVYPTAISELSKVGGPTTLPSLPRFRSPESDQPSYTVSKDHDVYQIDFGYEFDEGMFMSAFVTDYYVSYIQEWRSSKYPPPFDRVVEDVYSDRPRHWGMCIEYRPESAARELGTKGGYIVNRFDPVRVVTDKVVIESNEQLLAFYRSEPGWIRWGGIWALLTHPNQYSPEELDRLERLKTLCRNEGVALFVRSRSTVREPWKRY